MQSHVNARDGGEKVVGKKRNRFRYRSDDERGACGGVKDAYKRKTQEVTWDRK